MCLRSMFSPLGSTIVCGENSLMSIVNNVTDRLLGGLLSILKSYEVSSVAQFSCLSMAAHMHGPQRWDERKAVRVVVGYSTVSMANINRACPGGSSCGATRLCALTERLPRGTPAYGASAVVDEVSVHLA